MSEYPDFGPFKIGDQILGDLEVVGFLGMGGHAYVYECADQYMDARLAVKVIPNVPGRGRDFLTRARAEARLLFKLNHTNVVRVMNARPVGDKMVCIVMEKLDGLSLRQFLRLHKRLTVTEALLIVRQIASGVGAAHRMNVIHRDLKPENIFLLPPDNQVKVLDFGIAKFLGQGLETTNKFRIHGTPLYMSPEHLQSSNITHRSDIYELGAVAFELMTGKIPCLVDVDQPDFQQLAYIQIMKPTPPLRRLITDVGPRTEQLIKRATAKDPAQRFASMQEVVDAIDVALAEQKKMFPREAASIRYLDDAMVLAAKRAEEATDEDEDDWEPLHTPAPQQPAPTVSVPAPVTNAPVAAATAPESAAPKRARPPVMAPTVEIERPQQPTAQATVATVAAPEVVSPAVPSPSVSSLNLYATDNSFSGEAVPRTSWLKIPIPILLTTIVIGLGISVVISLPDIQRARARSAAPASAPTASALPLAAALERNIAVTAPSSMEHAEPPPLPSASAASSMEHAEPPPLPPATAVTSAKMPVASAAPPKPKPAAKAARKPAFDLFIEDEPPTVTKAELDRMRAREKALAADLDRETKEAAARKAKAVKP